VTLQHFSAVLFRERHLLELLLFKLEEEQLLLEAGRTRWLSHASREVETVLDELSAVELSRVAALASVGQEVGLPDEATTLAQIVHALPSPWDGIFAEHQQVLLKLSAQVLEAAESNRQQLRDGYEPIRQALAGAS
jgi:hypothetical protein